MNPQDHDRGRIRVDQDLAAEIEEALYAHIGRLWERKHAGEDVNDRLRHSLKAQRYVINLRTELGWPERPHEARVRTPRAV